MKNCHGIHPSAQIGDGVSLGRNVTIGPGAIVYDNVSLGDDSFVGAQTILGEPTADLYARPDSYRNPPLSIGPNAVIRSGSIVYAGSTIGPGFQTGHRVTIREETRIGRDVRIGTLSDVQGHCEIGDFVRFHSNVHIGQKSRIGDYVWIFPYTVLTNDPHPPSNVMVGVTVHDYAVITTMVVILAGVTIGRDALVGASSLVRADVPAEMLVAGNPAKEVCSVRDFKSKFTGGTVYPWREHFERGMPWQGVGFDRWSRNQSSGT